MSVPASHRAHPSETILQSKQLTPLCIATKTCINQTKGAKQTARAGRIVRSGSISGTQLPVKSSLLFFANWDIMSTSFLLGVNPRKPPHKPSQKKRTQTARNTSNCCALPIVPNLPSSHPTIKNMRAEQTGDQKRLTLMSEMHPRCRSKRCASRIIPPRHSAISTL